MQQICFFLMFRGLAVKQKNVLQTSFSLQKEFLFNYHGSQVILCTFESLAMTVPRTL